MKRIDAFETKMRARKCLNVHGHRKYIVTFAASAESVTFQHADAVYSNDAKRNSGKLSIVENTLFVSYEKYALRLPYIQG